MNPLGLTPAQQQKLQALSQKMRPDIMAALKKAKTGQEANKAMVAVQAKWNPQIMAILTPAQRAKFKTLRAQALKANAAAAARVKALPKK
jgi:Spy/CpxP family protein refolding chaperone